MNGAAVGLLLLALLSALTLLMITSWANVCECIGLWWLREAGRARRRDRAHADRLADRHMVATWKHEV